ncbi:kinase-like domain-containing protein [Lasiosphaeria hispida]|uniref:Kinase-like domain-containing protein n=1 Tax=Lasiosphaeria hispida TaxID=260671 RepID=A0AAJ0HAV2_9PEZI|nr:kinase-like domain-containing protein [Lasiosphaeria hispida]
MANMLPPGTPNPLATIDNYRKQSATYFQYLRQGRIGEWRELNNQQRARIWRKHQAHLGGIQAYTLDPQRHYHYGIPGSRGPDSGGRYGVYLDSFTDTLTGKMGAAKGGALDVARVLRGHLGLRYRRMQGWGGNGVAVVFEYTPPGPLRRTKFCIAKMSYGAANNPRIQAALQKEKRMMNTFDGSEHMVPELDILANTPQPQQARHLTLITPYYDRGNLGSVIKRADGYAITSRTLWLIFDCLFQMVVALRYPPQHWSDHVAGNPRRERTVAATTPRTAAQAAGISATAAWWKGCAEDWVHFDIDPSNIFVGDYDAAGPHSLVPALKLGDFGNTQDVNAVNDMAPHLLRRTRLLWESRLMGKDEWLTPEQFTSEWDYVRISPKNATEPANIAANYSWKTNLYGIAMVMWCLITRRSPPDGPCPEEMDIGGVPTWTFGNYLNDDYWGNTDANLRELVAKCLCENPADRPDMLRIRFEINRALRGPANGQWPGGEDDNTTRNGLEAQRLWRAYDIPGPRDGRRMQKWLAGKLNSFIGSNLKPR